MPNWCCNVLNVSGPEAEMIKFADKFENKMFSLNAHHPLPKQLEGVHEGYTTIDGKEVTRWRSEDGVDVPMDVENLLKETGHSGWYSWCCANWGTKWDVRGDDIEVVLNSQEGESSMHITFDTAWSPPVEWVEKVSADYPELLFELCYAEGGMGFWGVVEYKAGDVLSQGEHTGMGTWVDDEYVNSPAFEQFMEEHGLPHCGG